MTVLEAIEDAFLETNATLVSGVARPLLIKWTDIYVSVSIILYVFSLLSASISQVDKVWPFMPVVYLVLACAEKEFMNARLLWMTFVISVWSIRLSMNFIRRGGYAFPKIWEGIEKPRWDALRNFVGDHITDEGYWYDVIWEFMSFFVIHFGQMALLVMLSSPAIAALEQAAVPMDTLDWVLGIAILILVGIEGTADDDQNSFQQEKAKHNVLPVGELSDGFVQTGLFAYCRHPNYVCEQLIWICFAGFSLNLCQEKYWWTGIGAVLLIVWFSAIVTLTEQVLFQEYRQYEIYQERVWMYLPLGSNTVDEMMHPDHKSRYNLREKED